MATQKQLATLKKARAAKAKTKRSLSGTRKKQKEMPAGTKLAVMNMKNLLKDNDNVMYGKKEILTALITYIESDYK